MSSNHIQEVPPVEWMGETGRVSPETVADVLTALKEGGTNFSKQLLISDGSFAESMVLLSLSAHFL